MRPDLLKTLTAGTFQCLIGISVGSDWHIANAVKTTMIDWFQCLIGISVGSDR